MSATLGGFEKLLLLAVLRLGADAYGARIFEEIETRTGRGASPGAVYVTLRRLEKKGLVAPRSGRATPERGGRSKKIYSVTEDGLGALRDARREWDAMAEGLEGLLEAES